MTQDDDTRTKRWRNCSTLPFQFYVPTKPFWQATNLCPIEEKKWNVLILSSCLFEQRERETLCAYTHKPYAFCASGIIVFSWRALARTFAARRGRERKKKISFKEKREINSSEGKSHDSLLINCLLGVESNWRIGLCCWHTHPWFCGVCILIWRNESYPLGLFVH